MRKRVNKVFSTRAKREVDIPALRGPLRPVGSRERGRVWEKPREPLPQQVRGTVFRENPGEDRSGTRAVFGSKIKGDRLVRLNYVSGEQNQKSGRGKRGSRGIGGGVLRENSSSAGGPGKARRNGSHHH